MEEMLIRTLRKSDEEDLRKLIADAWYPKDAFSDQKLRSDLIRLEATFVLVASDWKRVVETEDEVKAVICGRLSRRRLPFRHICRGLGLVGLFLKLFLRSKASRRALAEEWDYYRVMRRLKRKKSLGRTAECTLFIVHSDLRGKGAGKKLMKELAAKAEQAGKANIHLFTDTSCNYGFYDAYGFDRLAACEMYSRTEKEERFEVYLYKLEIT